MSIGQIGAVGRPGGTARRRVVAPPAPSIQLSAASVGEDATIGTTIGTLSVINGTGSWTFTETSDPSNKFTVSGGNLVLSALLDYETATSHSVGIQATNGTDTISATFTISVVNVLEGTLGPTTASIAEGAAAGTLVATFTGLDAGASEVVTSLSPNDGRLAIAGSGSTLVVGLSAASAGSIGVTLTTSAGRTLAMTVTVASARLALTERIVFADNSYGAQTNAIDYVPYAWAAAGGRGRPTLGLRQARGGDRLTHLIDRWSAIDAIRPGLVVVMNIENDLADAAVTADAAGGAVLLARVDQVIALARASGVKRILIPKQVATNSAIGSKAAAATAYNAGLDSRAATDVVIMDLSAAFNPQDATQSSDATHPNTAKSAKSFGEAIGAYIKAQFVTDEIFGADGQVAGNLNANWALPSAGTITNSTSGATVTQSSGYLRDRPAVPCRILNISGTVTADPTSTGNIQWRFATSGLPAGLATIGHGVGAYALVEIGSSTGGDPVGLASLQGNAGVSQAWGTTYSAAQGSWNNGKRFAGVLAIPSKMLSVQSLIANVDLICRGLQGAVDIEIRVAWINLVDTEATSYGPVVNASQVFTVGRPLLAALPTTTPTSGTLAVGGTLALGSSFATFFGGGITRTYDVMRDATTDVGDVTQATASASATGYTVVAADSGHTLAIRHNGANDNGGGSSASVQTAALAVA